MRFSIEPRASISRDARRQLLGRGGEIDGLDTLWVAPSEWADPDGGEGDFICHFGLDVVPLAEARTTCGSRPSPAPG